jgi:hypothetical protein
VAADAAIAPRRALARDARGARAGAREARRAPAEGLPADDEGAAAARAAPDASAEDDITARMA